ncbi:type II toxin-antitoxin system VapB family antitoxin [Roseomonas sp. OT10]|uniref:type II toxin-antitoxin system VapB family antitoxin n=1 Tax=Roseomonas cutis TaxID=2897332 RepID=UPI001E350C9B|nr:type II toxin-antitoxin system VapB family antitoxin [Roseomonas sp. OT10]UFN51512.1 type II toxin-antitoxin system VapB family antitoxin [Roseomonas sp. OT10]
MNVKDEALIAEARALAELLGTSVTGALREAVRDRLARERTAREAVAERQRKLDAILAITARTAPLLAGSEAEFDHGRLLYDPDTGLPA